MADPKAGSPYTPIVAAGDWLAVSGQIGQVDGIIVDGGLVAQTKQALENLKTVLHAQGANLDDVVKTNVFLTSMDDFAAMNEIYVEHFNAPRPARSTVAVTALPFGAVVEIEAWGYLGKHRA